MNTPCALTATHCENCGSTSGEDTDPFGNDGYSSCCNELIVDAMFGGCRNHHGQN